jgi:hypothetical protein
MILIRNKEDRKMNANELIKKAQEELASVSKLPVNAVIGLAKNEEGLLVSVDAL